MDLTTGITTSEPLLVAVKDKSPADNTHRVSSAFKNQNCVPRHKLPRKRLNNVMFRILFFVVALVIFLSIPLSAQTGSISLEQVNGLVSPDTISSDRLITFIVRFTNNSGKNLGGYTNGFRIYSPTGATWNATSGASTGAILADMINNQYINAFSVDGLGADTIGFGGFQVLRTGIPNGFSAPCWYINIGPIPFPGDSQTICIDSSFYRPAGLWKWSVIPSADFFPDWDGPHCFTIMDCSTADDGDTDGINDPCDNCPDDQNAGQEDTDSDGFGDLCDNCPDTSNVMQADSDSDLVGDVCDNCPDISNFDQFDTDSDGIGDACDNCPLVFNPDQLDSDSNGEGDACADDQDGDGIVNAIDNCPTRFNPIQEDSDADLVGDSCDVCAGHDDLADADGDTVPDSCDICPGHDDLSDFDFDGFPDSCDNCPQFNNSTQADSDNDTRGDACDKCPGFDDLQDGDADGRPDSCDICQGFDDFADFDNDSYPDSCDNCPTEANPTQTDSNHNGIGDACESVSVPGDYVENPSGLPRNFGLAQNYPNPFNSTTILKYAVSISSPVKLSIYNLLGQRVIDLVDDYRLVGYYEIHWNGQDRTGSEVPTGVYLYRLETVQGAFAKKMIYLK